MRWRNAWLGLAVLVHGADLAAIAPTDEPCPDRPVCYLEYPEGGGEAADGRSLPAASTRFGIDINSNVTVQINERKLQEAIAPHLPAATEDKALQLIESRLKILSDAVAKIAGFPVAYRMELEAYEAYERAGRPAAGQALEAFNEARQARATLAGEVVDPVLIARQQRLLSLDATLDERAALREASESMAQIMPTGARSYDLQELSRVYDKEIRLIDADVSSALGRLISNHRVAVEIRGNLVRRDGSRASVRLPGHNTVMECEETRFEKIEFQRSQEEEELYKEYADLATRIRETKSSGARFKLALEASFGAGAEALYDALESMRRALDGAEAAFRDLRSWADAETLRRWYREESATRLSGSSAYQEFTKAVEETDRDVAAIRALIAAADEARRQSPMDAFLTMFAAVARLHKEIEPIDRPFRIETWKMRFDTAGALLGALPSLGLQALQSASGPIESWTAFRNALGSLRDAAGQAGAEARALLARLRAGQASELMANLPIPVGQSRHPLSTDLDTEFNLRTICGERNAGDSVILDYVFYSGEEQLTQWQHTFLVRVFGWQARALAGLFLVREENTAEDAGTDRSWEPTATTSLLFSARKWPGDDDAGLKGQALRRPFSFGVSMMPLDFEDEQDLEFAIGVTLSFVDDWFQMGHGWNLQAEDDAGFFYFGARLLKIKDDLGTHGP